jgi:hypothetical protein
MSGKSFWGVSSGAVLATAVLASCGGDIVAAVAFIGSAGGDWRLDASAEPGLQSSDCGGDACQVNIQRSGVDADDALFASDFDVTFTSSLPDCPDSGVGRIEGQRVELEDCLVGEYLSVNEVQSSTGQRFLFETFFPDLTTGTWVEIEDERRRFKFVDVTPDPIDPNTSLIEGCELTTPTVTPVTLRVVRATFDQDPPPVPFETRIDEFVIGAGSPWTGRFIGISGLDFRRDGQRLKLERRRDTDPPTTC